MFTAKPPGPAHEAQRVENILRGVAAADGLEHAVVERLRVDADAVDPCARSTCSLSAVMVSGRPASTVNSRRALRSNAASSCVHSASSWRAESVVGVPPPM